MFLQFTNQEERKEKYGSCFLELSYCKLKRNTSLRKILKIKNLPNWQNDSLYVFVDDLYEFFKEYNEIFDIEESSLYSVKYFSFDKAKEIIDIIKNKKPKDYEIILKWLEYAIENNGFYILGI